MAYTWTDSSAAHFQDAYLDWSHYLKTRRDALVPAEPDLGSLYEPIFVRLKPSGDPATIETSRAQLEQTVEDSTSPVLMDPHEFEVLSARNDDPDYLSGLPDEYALYRRLGTPDSDYADLMEVLDTGAPVHLAAGTSIAMDAPHADASSTDANTPIVALIDDGIGFLNARFCKADAAGHLTSRFHGVWLQSTEQRPVLGARVVSGDVITKDEINAMLGQDEADAYAALNTRLYDPQVRRSTDFSTSHGTHVLDLAAGADPSDTANAVRDWPLLGVQLPPEAIEDTSGVRFESYLLQGLRWILRQAGRVNPDAPVIINISMGILAGPKNGTRFVEYQAAREAESWQAATGQQVRLVWSFGNTYASNLVAKVTYAASNNRIATDNDLTWRVQPSDETASYVEVRTVEGDSSDIEVALTAPDGSGSGFAPIAPGHVRDMVQNTKSVARMYHVPARDLGNGAVSPAHYVLALAPTDSNKAGEPLAPSGGWTVSVRYKGKDALRVTLQVQRDDALRGYRAQARQSYFDDASAYEWNHVAQDWSALGVDCPIFSQGSHSALATSASRLVFSVGAAIYNPVATGGLSPANLGPSPYSAEGSDWSVPGPTVSTVADDGLLHRGVTGAGTLSGASRHMSGTSAAAGRLSRALGLSAAKIRRNGAKGTQTDDLNKTALNLLPVPASDVARLGAYVVCPPESYPARR